MARAVANSLLDDPHAWVLFACAGVLAGFYALLRPPLDALGRRVVPREQMKAAWRSNGCGGTSRRSPGPRSAAC